jgi:hypothetical protein
MNIYQKLIEVRKTVPYLQKENKGYQFNYVSSSQVLAALKHKMDEVGLLLIPSVTGKNVTIDTYEKPDGRGNAKRTVDIFTELDLTFTWVNAEKPEEKIECKWYGQGMDTAGEKGVGKALTYAEKYFMLKFFNIPTDKDDPDSFQEKMDDTDKPTQSSKATKPLYATREEKAKVYNLAKTKMSKSDLDDLATLFKEQITKEKLEQIQADIEAM